MRLSHLKPIDRAELMLWGCWLILGVAFAVSAAAYVWETQPVKSLNFEKFERTLPHRAITLPAFP